MLIALCFPFCVPNNSGMFKISIWNSVRATAHAAHISICICICIFIRPYGMNVLRFVVCFKMHYANCFCSKRKCWIKYWEQTFMKFERTNASNVNALYILHILRVKFNLHFWFVSYSFTLFFFLSLSSTDIRSC